MDLKVRQFHYSSFVCFPHWWHFLAILKYPALPEVTVISRVTRAPNQFTRKLGWSQIPSFWRTSQAHSLSPLLNKTWGLSSYSIGLSRTHGGRWTETTDSAGITHSFLPLVDYFLYSLLSYSFLNLPQFGLPNYRQVFMCCVKFLLLI